MKIYLVTHSGLCHTDDVACAALLGMLFPTCELRRTRSEEEIKDLEGTLIVFDVFGGDLDHHKDEPEVDGRKLSAIGKVWRAYRRDIMAKFAIDAESWQTIDRDFIADIDRTDNTGVMNAFNFAFNAMRATSNPTTDETFSHMVEWMTTVWESIFHSEEQRTATRKEYAALPIEEFCGLRVRINESRKFIGSSTTDPEADAYVWQTAKGTLQVKMMNGHTLSRKGLKEGDVPGVVFTHVGGWLGEVATKADLAKIL